MSTFVESSTRAVDRVVSPELALVDSALAELERAQSAVPAPRPRVRPHLTWCVDEGSHSYGTFSLHRVTATVAAHATTLGRRRPRLLVFGAACLVALVAFVLPDIRSGGRSDPVARLQAPAQLDVGTPPSASAPAAKPKPPADGDVGTPPSASALAAKPKPPADGVPRDAGSRRFAWAPVAGATAYHVEFFRGQNRVLMQNTTGTRHHGAGTVDVPREQAVVPRRRVPLVRLADRLGAAPVTGRRAVDRDDPAQLTRFGQAITLDRFHLGG